VSATAEMRGKRAAITRLCLFLPVPTDMCREIPRYSDKHFLLTSGNAAKTPNTGQALVRLMFGLISEVDGEAVE